MSPFLIKYMNLYIKGDKSQKFSWNYHLPAKIWPTANSPSSEYKLSTNLNFSCPRPIHNFNTNFKCWLNLNWPIFFNLIYIKFIHKYLYFISFLNKLLPIKTYVVCRISLKPDIFRFIEHRSIYPTLQSRPDMTSGI